VVECKVWAKVLEVLDNLVLLILEALEWVVAEFNHQISLSINHLQVDLDQVLTLLRKMVSIFLENKHLLKKKKMKEAKNSLNSLV
jgi:hypothetical protein